MTGALSSVALDERRGAEILQTGAGRGERLAATVSTSSGVLELKILIDIGKLKSFLYPKFVSGNSHGLYTIADIV